MTASSSDVKPSVFWRGVIRAWIPRGPSDDRKLLEYCAQVYAEEKHFLEETLARGASDLDIRGARAAVYVIALALLTYGRLDVIGDVLENMLPYPHPTNRRLSQTVDALFPVTGGLHAGRSPREVLAWIRANESRLRWDEEVGQFVLE